MSLVETLTAEPTQHELQDSVQTVKMAELHDEPVQNGRQRNVNASKNTHFEMDFGGDADPEVSVYIERGDTDAGLEVMMWAERAWFPTDAFEDFGPRIADGGELLEEFTETLLKLVQDEFGSEATPRFEYYSQIGGWVIFSATFYF